MHANLLLQIVLFSLVAVCSCDAFRVDTHVLIAQDVADDVIRNHGQVTFSVPGRTISIKAAPKVLEAITHSRSAFLLGSIGPDAFPGIYEGQMSIHPGTSWDWNPSSPHGWGSSDYLAFLFQQASSLEQLSFSYGVATHLAADVFAHTYINAYAGGCWNLTDADATVVEQRHFALEGFVALHNPPTRAVNLSALLSRSQLSSSTVKFIRDGLFLNKTVADNYNRDCPHVAKIFGLQVELRKLIEDNGPLRTLQDEIERAVWNKYIGVRITTRQLRELRKLRQHWKTLETKGLTEMHNGVDELLRLCNSVNGFQGDARSLQFQALANAAGAADKAISSADSLNGEARNLTTKKNELERKIVSAIPLTPMPPRIGVNTPFGFVEEPGSAAARRIAGAHRRVEEGQRQALLHANDEFARLQKQIVEAQRKLQSALPSVKRQVKDVQGALDEIDGVIATGIKAARDADAIGKDITIRTNSDTFALVSIVEGWVGDIDVAMDEYVFMNADVIPVLSDNKAKNGQAFDLIETWMSCQFPKIIGAGPISTTRCKVEARLDECRAHLDKLNDYILSLGGLLPIKEKLEQIRQKIETQVREEVRSFVLEKLEPKLKSIVKLLEGPLTDEVLRETFTQSAGGVALLPIPDIASRARADMGIGTSHSFDRDTFAPYRNAVILSKLALLDGNGLNELAEELGVIAPTDFADGQPLYPSPSDLKSDLRSASNRYAPVLSGAILSIDGNHQWHRDPPPYARTKPPYAAAVHSRLNGFRIWDDPQAREKLFRGLFAGPIAPGLDAPEEFANPSERILPNDYVWRTCRAHPFPDNYADSGCGR